MRGNRDEAVDEALENKNYALALLIAGMSGFDTYQIVAQRFADEVLSPGSPLHTVALMLSKNLQLPSSEELANPDSESFWSNDIYHDLKSTWRCQLASILRFVIILSYVKHPLRCATRSPTHIFAPTMLTAITKRAGIRLCSLSGIG